MKLTACAMTTGCIGWSAVQLDALTPALSHGERGNTQPVGPVSEAPPGDWVALRSDALTPTLSQRERENTQSVGPVSEAPPGDWAALRANALFTSEIL